MVQLIQSSGSSSVLKLCGSNDKEYLICDYGWDFVDASVACKSLGLSPYGAIPVFDQYVSSTLGYNFLSYMSCYGTESTLAVCDSETTNFPCTGNYAGVRCQGLEFMNVQIFCRF